MKLTRIQQIDQQHERIAAALDELRGMVVAGRRSAEIGEKFGSLVDEYRRHCGYEEELLGNYAYPGVAKQTKGHRDILQRLENMKTNMQSGSLRPAAAEVDLIIRWFEEHVDGVDAAYSEFLRSEGVV